MREIKFRAWDKTNEKWIDTFLLSENGSIYCVPDEIPESEIDWDNIEIVQYTGLKDKNDKEIYEGDIILEDAVVIWKEDITGFGINTGKYGLRNYRDRDDFEVIGNIYENPELLEEIKHEN